MKDDTGTGQRAALYVRVSSDEQTTLNQEPKLRQWAKRLGLKVVKVYDDTDALTLDPSQADYSVPNESPLRRRSSKVGIDATRKHGYPPLAIPPKEHLDRVAADWGKYGIREVGV